MFIKDNQLVFSFNIYIFFKTKWFWITNQTTWRATINQSTLELADIGESVPPTFIDIDESE